MNLPPTTEEKQFLMVGSSKAMEQVKYLVSRAAPTTAGVLITGESGVGKETVARTIHVQSPRADRFFVALSCDAIPKELIEGELFGPEHGTSADEKSGRSGRLREADKGTLFLDEVAEMSLAAQARLLRFLEHPVAERQDSSEAGVLDVRVIAATNRNLAECVRNGTLNGDFLRRLSVVTINVPRLRDRPEDIEELTAHFLADYCRQYGRVLTLAPECQTVLRMHDWPGNVRELRNLCERVVVLARSSPVGPEELRSLLNPDSPVRREAPPAAEDRVRLQAVQRALAEHGSRHRRRRRHHHGLGHRLRRWLGRLPRRTTATLVVVVALAIIALLLVSIIGC